MRIVAPAAAAFLLLGACADGPDPEHEGLVFGARPYALAADDRGVAWLEERGEGVIELNATPVGGDTVYANDMLPIVDIRDYVAVPPAPVLDGDRIYYAAAATVYWVSRDGGEPAVLAQAASTPADLDVADGYVHWVTESGEVQWVPTEGGEVITVHVPTALGAVRARGDQLYVMGTDSLHRVDRRSRAATLLGRAQDWTAATGSVEDHVVVRSVDLALTGDRVMWMVAQLGLFTSQDRGAIIAFPLDGGAPAPFATGLYGPTRLAADASDVYWHELSINHHATVTGRADPSELYTAPAAGGPATRFIACTDLNVSGLAVTSHDVIWSTPGAEYDHGLILGKPR